MPTAELTNKLIKILITDISYKIAGVLIEHNSFTWPLQFTVNNIAYTQDIEALDKKIKVLSEQSHANDADIYNTYATVDEVNTVLTNYALKNELLPAVDLSGYRKLNDITATSMKEAEFEKLTNRWKIKIGVEYIESVHFVLKYGETTYDFDFTIDEEDDIGGVLYIHNLDNGLKFKCKGNELACSLYLLDIYGHNLDYEMLAATYPVPDEFALKSQIEELKTENAELRATIATIEARLAELEAQ